LPLKQTDYQNIENLFFAEKGKKGAITVETTSISVNEIFEYFNQNKISLDYYQREYVYDAKNYEKASKVIETILFGKVLPAIVYRNNEGTGRFEIIDGQQRTLSIIKFIQNEFALNFKHYDDAHMLNGLKFKDFSPELKKLILHYRLTAMRIVTTVPEIVTEIFLDLNFQPVAVTEDEISTSVVFGDISKKARELTTYRDTTKINFVTWALFGHQNKYTANDKFRILTKDKRGTISIAVLRTMLTFIDKEIILEQDSEWIKSQLVKSKDKELKEFELDKFENFSNYIYSLFKKEIREENKEKSPFFYIDEGRVKAQYLQQLADILFLGIVSIYKRFIINHIDFKISHHQKIDREIKALFIEKIKPEIIKFKNDEKKLNSIKDYFLERLNLIINN
jgi:hypothetical protein